MRFKQVVEVESVPASNDTSGKVRSSFEHLDDTRCVAVSSLKRFEYFMLSFHVLFFSSYDIR